MSVASLKRILLSEFFLVSSFWLLGTEIHLSSLNRKRYVCVEVGEERERVITKFQAYETQKSISD